MEALEITNGVVIPSIDLTATFSRSAGPGGQHVNKVETRVALRFALATTTALSEETRRRLAELARHRLTREGDLVLVSQRTRSQVKNLEDCRERLRSLILRALEPPTPRLATRPGPAARERRLADKARQARKKRERRAGDPDEL